MLLLAAAAVAAVAGCCCCYSENSSVPGTFTIHHPLSRALHHVPFLDASVKSKRARSALLVCLCCRRGEASEVACDDDSSLH